jgi:DJ-1/PfpI family
VKIALVQHAVGPGLERNLERAHERSARQRPPVRTSSLFPNSGSRLFIHRSGQRGPNYWPNPYPAPPLTASARLLRSAGTRPQLHDEAQLNWVRRQRAIIPLMTSVCTGSLVYAAAGLLSNRPATTHWASLDKLAELDPTIDVRSEERFVDDGDTITASGVSAGIDMALHLIVRLAGPERAREVRHLIQYDPAPPV